MKRDQVFVRAQDPTGKWGSADVLDLTDESFRAFLVEMLRRAGIVVYLKDELVDGEEITYHTRTTFEEE